MDRELTFDEAEAAGFDGTGRDGDPRFPYHMSDLIDYPALTLKLVQDIGEALEDAYGKMPPRHILEMTFGRRVGGNLHELIEIARTGRSTNAEINALLDVMIEAEHNAYIPGFVFDSDDGTYSSDGERV